MLTDGEPTLAIGSLAIDPNTPTILYAGTGEANFSGDSYYGIGILKSTDGGGTWSLLGRSTFAGTSIGGVAVTTTGTIFASAMCGFIGAGVSFGESCSSSAYGLYESKDGGATWQRVAKVGQYGVQDLAVDAATQTKVFFSAPYSGAYVYDDQARTVTHISSIPTNAVRVAFAQSPSSPNVWYAGVGVYTTPGQGALYRSSDGGGTWAALPGTQPDFCGDQCWYDDAVVVDPSDPGTAYYGGSQCPIYKVTGGTTATPSYLAATIPGGDCGAGNVNWTESTVHSDLHGFAFDASGALWVAEDGGVAKTADAGATWTTPDTGLATIQFQGLCVEASNVSMVYGAAQDNGITAQPTTGLVWSEIYGGDGGPCVTEQTDPVVASQYLLVSTSDATLTRATSAAQLAGPSGGTVVFYAGPSCAGYPGCGDRVLFYAPLVADPSAPTTDHVGTNHLWQSSNGGTTWAELGQGKDLTAGDAYDALSAIAVAPTDSQRLYTGSAEGVVYVSKDGGGTWINVTKLPLPQRFVSALAVNPTNPDVVCASFSGFSANTPTSPGHVFESKNAGATWTRIDTSLGTLDVPFDGLVAHPIAPSLLYAGTDLGGDPGVLVSWDDGAHWTTIATGMPNAAVYSLVLHPPAASEPNAVLFAGTHGRSAWQVPLTPTIASDPAGLTFTAAPGGPDPPPQTVGVYDVDPGGSVLRFTVTPPTGVPWLSVGGALAGKVAGTMTSPLTVSVSVAGLALGGYDASIAVADADATNPTYSIPVHLDVTTAPPDAGTEAGTDSGEDSGQDSGTASEPDSGPDSGNDSGTASAPDSGVAPDSGNDSAAGDASAGSSSPGAADSSASQPNGDASADASGDAPSGGGAKPGSSSGCGCRVLGTSGSPGALVFLAGLAVVAARRRRRPK